MEERAVSQEMQAVSRSGEKTRKQILPRSLQKEYSPTNNLILEF